MSRRLRHSVHPRITFLCSLHSVQQAQDSSSYEVLQSVTLHCGRRSSQRNSSVLLEGCVMVSQAFSGSVLRLVRSRSECLLLVLTSWKSTAVSVAVRRADSTAVQPFGTPGFRPDLFQSGGILHRALQVEAIITAAIHRNAIHHSCDTVHREHHRRSIRHSWYQYSE